MDRAIRWSPSSTKTEQRFLSVDVTGKTLKLHRVTSFNGVDLQHEVQATHSKVPAFRAFDWSPVDESLVAIGQASGDASILRIAPGVQESFSFPIRSPRHCNAVAFSHHGLLAAGVDRTRHDFCLNVWDVNQRLAMKGTRGVVEPVKKLAGSEPITSIKFFRDQPDTLVAGVKGQFVRIYDLRGESVSRYWEVLGADLLVKGPGNPALQFPTKCVNNLAIDWLDENYIASCSSAGDPTICIWDRRVGSRLASTAGGPTHTPETGQPGPALEFKGVFAPKSSIWSLRFSRTKRGCLGVLSNTGHFKTYDIAKEYLSDEYRSSVDETLGQGSFENYPEPIYTKYVRDISSPFNHPSRGCNETDRIVSFDFLNISPSNESNAITLSGNGNVGMASLKPPPSPVGISSQGILIRGSPYNDVDFKTMGPPADQGRAAEMVKNIQNRVRPGSHGQPNGVESQPRAEAPLSSREHRERSLSLGAQGSRLSAEDVLALLTVNKLRCGEGYLFDAARNKRIVANDSYLQEFWTWVERARLASSGSSFIVNDLDMNYLGVYDVWNNDLGMALFSISTLLWPAN